MTLDAIERKLNARLGSFQGLNARVKYDFDSAGALYLDAKRSPPVLGREPIDSDCVIRMSLENFDRMIDGDLGPTMAFMTGKLKVQGSMPIALKLAALLED